MAITHDYTVICEMVRPEIGGKFTLIGMFPNGIATPQIPFPLPFLTFFNALRTESAGAYKFSGKLSQLATGEMVAAVQGLIQAGGPGPVILPVSFPNLNFKAFGSYVWALEIEGQDDPFVTEFQLAHVAVPPLGGLPPGRFKF